MEDQIKQIAARIRDMREILNISPEEAANSCGLSTDGYLRLENGQTDISVSVMHQLATLFGVEITNFLSGEEPRMHAYTLTRKGQGIAIERRKAYSYQALATNFINRKAEPYIVKVEPKSDDVMIELNSHPGQEFNLVLKGKMQFKIKNKEMILAEGDSIYFDSGLPHGMKAIENEACEFLAIIF